VTGDRLSDVPLWRELLSRYDVGDVVSVVFRDRFGCWGFLDLWRVGANARFGDAEIALLTEIAAPVTSALRRAQASTLLTRPPERPRFGPVVLLLSADLRLDSQTPEAADYLRTLLSPTGDDAPVPAAAYNVAAQLVAVELGIDSHPAAARVHLADGRWLSVRATCVGAAMLPRRPLIAVTIETASPAERSAVFARAFELTPRESELLAHVAAGRETREIAALMFLSEYTVQDHLKSVFVKTGIRTRRSLIGLVAGV
jgi:DNA-binding CsgD family transcriptional regulator